MELLNSDGSVGAVERAAPLGAAERRCGEVMLVQGCLQADHCASVGSL